MERATCTVTQRVTNPPVTIPRSLREQIITAANYRCEYCKLPSQVTGSPLIIDHILPRSLQGDDSRENLAASCYRCNEFKSDRTHGIDPEIGQLVSLFNPRSQIWSEHFTWINGGTHVAGHTSTGRATVIALRLNNENLVQARAIWMEFGWHPPNED